MKTKRFYLSIAMAAIAMFTLTTACESDSEDSAQDLARRYCDCEKINDLDSRERCLEKVTDQVQLHLKDATFMAAYASASKSCPK